MAEKTNILSDDLIYIFDKKSGEKFFKQSSMQLCEITHYKIKSEKSGKTLLLSGDGIKRRFTQTPHTERKQKKDILSWLSPDLVSRYIILTKEIMPHLARTSHKHWPVSNDHCFQRIVLDTVCGGVWYDQLLRPAYKNLTQDQAAKAVNLCNDIISGDTDLVFLNKQSLQWRGKF